MCVNIQDKFESACLESRRVGCELIIRCKFKSEIESMLTHSLSKSVHPIVPSKQASLQTLARNLTHFFPVCLFVYHIRPVTNISKCRLNLQTFFLIFFVYIFHRHLFEWFSQCTNFIFGPKSILSKSTFPFIYVWEPESILGDSSEL